MQLRELAERILFSTTLEEKLWCPEAITDSSPGQPLIAPLAPGRPPELRFKPHGSAGAEFPGLHHLEREHERGRLLHFFANHELLATELMALVLLRFPDAPPAFRRGVLQTLKDEQVHTRLYVERMRECGISFGEMPVSGYFWRCLSSMENPLDYVAGLSLTFEQANLDFARHFAQAFAQVGDASTAQLLSRIYNDEIGHVAYGLKWFRRWKNPEKSDWEAFSSQLKFPLSPRRAKGPKLNVEGRRAAGLDPHFIAELNVYSQSRGRTPSVFLFNPLAEGYIAYGPAFTPKKSQALLATDLANLPQFVCRQDDIVLVPKRPAVEFLSGLKEAGFVLPEFIEFDGDKLSLEHSLQQRKLAGLRPWAWSPDSVQTLQPLFSHLTGGPWPDLFFNGEVAQLYSKSWSAAFLARLLPNWVPEPWICPADEIGITVSTFEKALEVIALIRKRGHPRLVVKQAYGLAGHNAIRLWEPDLLPGQRQWIEHNVAETRPLVIEPWLERELDFSMQFQMEKGALKICGYAGLINDLKGQFQANWAAADFAQRVPAQVTAFFRDVPQFGRKLQLLCEEIRSSLESELRRVGYAGPVGIDAFVYRAASGQPRLKPIVEVNPRYTMGRVTLELMQRTAPGRCGCLRLVNRPALQSAGFSDFGAYAARLTAAAPIRLEGEPVAKLAEGVVCLNDPANAEMWLAAFKVGRNLDQLVSEFGLERL